MERHYSAFLLRHWRLGDDGTRRIEVVHIQSSARALVTSLGAAAAWIDNQGREPPRAPPGDPASPRGPRGGDGDAAR